MTFSPIPTAASPIAAPVAPPGPPSPLDRRRDAAWIAGLQAAVLGLAAVASLTAAARARRAGEVLVSRHDLQGALGLGGLAVLAVAVTIGLANRTRWSRPTAVLFEGLFVLNAVTLLVDAPVVSVVGTSIGVAAIVLLARGTATTGALPAMASIPRGRGASDAPPPAPGASAPGASSGTDLRLGLVLAGVVTATVVAAAVIVRSRTLFGLVLLAVLFIPIERVFALRRAQRVLRAHWANDVVHFLVNNLITLAVTAAGAVVLLVSLRWMVRPDFQAAVAAQPALLQFAEALLLADLVGYAMHRAHHQIGWLWRFHAVHHSIEEMDWLAAARLHPFDQALGRMFVVLPLFAFGFTRGTLGAFVVVFQLQAIFIHANVRFRFGPLRWLFATPEFHHWHHANEPAALDTNFAGQFPWIDRLFGTAHLPKGRMPAAYGCTDPVPDTWLAQMAYPFRRPAAGRNRSNL